MKTTTYKQTRDKWARMIVTLFLGVFLCACSNDLTEENIPEMEQQGSAEITFNVQTKNNLSTKAEIHTETVEGNEKENAIYSLQVLLYNKSNQFVGKFSMQQSAGGSYKGIIAYKKLSSCLNSNQEFEGKIMLLANCPQFDGAGDLSTLTFDFTQTAFNPNNKDGYIPMWGVITKIAKIAENHTVNFGTINLLRALAKIELNPNAEKGFGKGEYKIISATLSRYHTMGTCAPADCMSKSPTSDVEPDRCNIPSQATAQTSLAFKDNALYLPEMKSSAENIVNLTLQKGDDTTDTKQVSFRLGDYTDGDFVTDSDNDIVRNHIYRYNLSISQDNGLKLKVEIEDLEEGGTYDYEY